MEKTPVASEVAEVKPATPRKKAAPVRAAKAEKPPLAKKPATAAAAKKKPAPAARKTKAESAPSPAKAKLAKAEKPAKAKKLKLVRDSFTMPEPEYRTISLLKERCLKNGVAARKSEILRAAVASLSALRDIDLLAAVCSLEVIKTGRPAKGQK